MTLCLYDLIVTSQSTPLERFSFIAGAVELVKRATKDGFQIKHINTKLCRLEVLVTQYGGDQSVSFGKYVLRLIKKSDPLPDLSTLPRLSTDVPTSWDDIPITGSMPLGCNADYKGKVDGIRCNPNNSAKLTDLTNAEFKTFDSVLAPLYRAEKGLKPSVSVYLIYCRDEPTPKIFHSEERIRSVLESWGVTKRKTSQYVSDRTDRERPKVGTWESNQIVVFHSKVGE